MAERPILFSGAMVRAILAGTKTQTRRPVFGGNARRPGYARDTWGADGFDVVDAARRAIRRVTWCESTITMGLRCPYGVPGDQLWVRETHLVVGGKDAKSPRVVYRASNDGPDAWVSAVWRPSIFMSRKFSRLTLEVVEVRVQRVQEISEEDARAEGAEHHDGLGVGHSGWRHDRDHGFVYGTARQSFAALWDTVNGKRAPWANNPWVWAVTFKCVDVGAAP